MNLPARTLAIETASEACSVALFEGRDELASEHRVLGRGHAEQLVPMISALPDSGRADRILVSLGPGSFTGVRIGIATARALGFAWTAEVLGYPTLALVAAQALGPEGVTICMNGGHGEWFVQDFDHDGASTSVRSLTAQQAVELGSQPRIAGNRAQEFAAMFENRPVALNILPDARKVMALDEDVFTASLTPIYGRGPDATPLSERKPR